ncbi:WYL domain-containing protein, partial [Yoonia sp.]|uniref:WYL domain-containing protein n=1 Tax=Yoonia sp. TaxID=2212373 RepID=UPI003A4E370C
LVIENLQNRIQIAPQRNSVVYRALGLSYSDNTLALLAFCQLRQDYRVFHACRIQQVAENGESFRPRRVALLDAYRRSGG